MTLATHAVVGAAIASLIPNHPVASFCVGFGSHFLLDAIPHWDYNLRSGRFDDDNPMNNTMITSGRDFYLDLLKIGFDAVLGVVVGLWLFGPWGWSLLLGAAGAMAPDFLQFVYFKTRWYFVGLLQRFHVWIHARYKIKNRPVLGISLQLLLVVAVFLAVKFG